MNDYELGPTDNERLWRVRLEEAAEQERAWQYATAELNTQENKAMASIRDAFPSNWLKAADLQGRSFLVKIHEVVKEEVGKDDRLVVYFDGKGQKGLVLNKTNAEMIASKHGDDYETWGGAEVELYPDKTQFQGTLVDCIRVRIPVPRADTSQEIPF